MPGRIIRVRHQQVTIRTMLEVEITGHVVRVVFVVTYELSSTEFCQCSSCSFELLSSSSHL